MKRNAFTLVELIVVIVILSIIALIAFPAINKSINKSKYKAAYNSAAGLIEATDLYYSHNTKTPYIDNEIIFKCDGVSCRNDSNESLNIKGNVPVNGSVILYGDGSIELNYVAINNDYCIYGDKDNIKVKNLNCNTENIPGLYDENDNIIVSWYELVDEYNLNVEEDYSACGGSLTYDEHGEMLYDYGSCTSHSDNNKTLREAIIDYSEKHYEELMNVKLTKLIVDPSVKKIGAGSLSFLTDHYYSDNSPSFSYRIKEIVLPEGIKSINKYAFAYNHELTTLDIPNSVERIEINAFIGDKKLNGIHISKNVKSLMSPSSINAINVTIDKDNPYYTDFNSNYIVDKTANVLIYMGNNTVIPDGITSILTGAFPKSNPITDLVLPNTVENIEASSFENALKSLTIPASTKKIARNLGTYLFSEYTAKSLETITIDANNQYYSDKGSNVIYDLSKNKLMALISTSIIPAGTTKLDSCDFRIMSSTTIVIPSSVDEIEKNCGYTMSSSINIVFEEPTGWYKIRDYSGTEGEKVDFTKTTFQEVFNNNFNFSRLRRNTSS